MLVPKIACIGVIGKNDEPLHIALFTPFLNSRMQFSFLINNCIDIVNLRQKQSPVEQDLGLLQALDERIAAYGWLTNTGVKFLILVDMAGRHMPDGSEKGKATEVSGLKESDLKLAFRALQTAYIRLLQNPFHVPDDHVPLVSVRHGFRKIVDQNFINEVNRIGTSWVPGSLQL